MELNGIGRIGDHQCGLAFAKRLRHGGQAGRISAQHRLLAASA
jgi:hypothetical protein